MIRVSLTYLTAAAGVAAFSLAGLPLPWLLGPIFACLLAGLCGLRMGSIRILNEATRTILGVAVGATITVTLLTSMASMLPTLAMIPVMIAAIGLIGVPYFQRLWGFDFATSYYGAMPGGLQDMLVFGEEAGGDIRALSLIHATRVLMIVAVSPFVLQGVWEIDLDNPPGLPAASMPPSQMVLMVFAGITGWRAAKAVGLFGASILGPMILAAALSLTGLLENRPPAEAIQAAQFFIGMGVGAKFAGVKLHELRRDVTAAAGFCVILLILAGVFVEAIHLMSLAPPLETFLAFAPGGQAEMTVLALIAGADLAFVIAHHVLRLLTVILGAPVAARLARRRPRD